MWKLLSKHLIWIFTCETNPTGGYKFLENETLKEVTEIRFTINTRYKDMRFLFRLRPGLGHTHPTPQWLGSSSQQVMDQGPALPDSQVRYGLSTQSTGIWGLDQKVSCLSLYFSFFFFFLYVMPSFARLESFFFLKI